MSGSPPAGASLLEKKVMELYAAMLNEVRVRLRSIGTICMPGSSLEPLLAEEYGYLQLRKICELIALGCLVAHGDLDGAATQKMRTEWSAEAIVKRLGKLHSNFYPIPHRVETIRSPDGLPASAAKHHLHDTAEKFLTRDRFLSLYAHCGTKLHRGTLKRLEQVTEQIPRALNTAANLNEVINWHNEIAALLAVHRISSLCGLRQYVCVLSSEQHGGNSLVLLARAD